MLAIGLRFCAGRYHATPWGRHVNEADVEWPPSPWRMTRALIAVWHRKTDHELYPQAMLVELLAQLAGSPPEYRLPATVHAHLRHYMPVREGAKEKNTLIFDAFARVSSAEELVIAWPAVVLEEETSKLFDELLRGLSYLGRAESWVEARRIPLWEGTPNCILGDNAVDETTGELSEVVPLLRPKSPAAYEQFRASWQDVNLAKGKKKRKIVLPEDWLTAVSLETADLQSAGWSQPPAAQRVYYRRPAGALKPAVTAAVVRVRKKIKTVTTVRYAIYGRPLPRMEEAVRIGELVRIALMHLAQKHLGQVPALLSGHSLPKGNRHHHAFFLPECNDQGRIGHLLVHAPGGFDVDHLQVFQKLKRLFTRDGKEWQVLYEGCGDINAFDGTSLYAGGSSIWSSLTPYLHPWHAKKNFGVTEQILRECRLRGLPEPAEISPISEVLIGNVMRRPVHFYRFRSKRGVTQPDTLGSLVKVTFAEQVSGPLALGFACHYGLGLFLPQG